MMAEAFPNILPGLLYYSCAGAAYRINHQLCRDASYAAPINLSCLREISGEMGVIASLQISQGVTWSILILLLLWCLDKPENGAEVVTDNSAFFFLSHIIVINYLTGLVLEGGYDNHYLKNLVSRIAQFECYYLVVLALCFHVWSNSSWFATWLFTAARLFLKTFPYGDKVCTSDSILSGSSAFKSCALPTDAHCSVAIIEEVPIGDGEDGGGELHLNAKRFHDSTASFDISSRLSATRPSESEQDFLSDDNKTTAASSGRPDSGPLSSNCLCLDTRIQRLRSRRHAVDFQQQGKRDEGHSSSAPLRIFKSMSSINLPRRAPSRTDRMSAYVNQEKPGDRRATKASTMQKVMDEPEMDMLKNAIQRILLPRCHNSALKTLFTGGIGRNVSHENLAEITVACTTEKLEIMIVEDDKVQQAVMAKLLMKYGFSVTAVDSGEHALDRLAERLAEDCGHKCFPAIILMDLILPGMSGFQATEAIRREYPNVPLPIIIVTGCEETQETLVQSIRCGANDMVEKPHVPACLMARISAQLTVLHFWRSKIAAKKNDTLLQEILPRSVIERIGPSGSRRLIYDEHKEVSIVFTDIVGFTEFSSSADTRAVIKLLDTLFNAFDSLTQKHGVYKVETIGDAYMLVAGHEEESQADHALRAVHMAADMLEVARGIKMPNGEPLRVRAGIHSGPAFSGVVGHLRPRYCLFGDTVNVASRMESTSFADCIQLSKSTVECYESQCLSLQQLDASCAKQTARKNSKTLSCQAKFIGLGPREIKGKGEMDTALMMVGDWGSAWKRYNDLKCSHCLPSK